MRIISGKYKGRTIRPPVGIRPTSDKLRETVFNIIQHEIGGAKVLDLYAGSGAYGIEALSRGAASVTFVDQSGRSISAIKANLNTLGENQQVVQADALEWVRNQSGEYDLIFIDPPYDSFDSGVLESGQLLGERGILLLEISSRTPDPATPDALDLLDKRLYGDTKLMIFQNR